ncbi:MAG: putative toxin-antitoxin system toxin component, PIN family [Cyanobacteria bacterium P01_G01_bin.19]
MITKIVIDTNVFVSVLIGQSESASRELLRRCLQRKYQPLMGNALFAEYHDVINRDHITNLCPLTNTEKTNLLAAFMSVCQWVRVYYLWRPNLLDEADNHLIELAMAGSAQIIATRNIKDFKQSQLKFPQLKILKPEELLHY